MPGFNVLPAKNKPTGRTCGSCAAVIYRCCCPINANLHNLRCHAHQAAPSENSEDSEARGCAPLDAQALAEINLATVPGEVRC